jgi:hypothetical protein
MRIVELKLDEKSINGGIDAVALVENPAIEEDFFMFNKEEFQSFTDYPQAVVDAAKQGIKRNEALGNKCGTQVGKTRAQQLAQRQPISLDTVKRMFSFLSRQKDNYDLAVSRRDYDACGYISYLLWGGPSALTWSNKILNQQENLSEEDQIVQDTIIENMITEGIIKEEMKKLTECKHNYISDLSDEKQDALIDALNSVGINEDDILGEGYVAVDKSQYSSIISEAFSLVSDPKKGSVADFGNFRVLYKYVGPRDNKNRDFCSRVLSANLLFRKEDINELSVKNENEEFGFYDIFKWRGSYNCRHNWQAQLFYKTDENLKKAAANLNILSSAQSTKVIRPETGNTLGLESLNEELAEGFSAIKNGDQQILVGPLMVPDKLIPRRDKDGNEYQVYFSEETVEKLAYKSMYDKIIDRINIEHTEELIDDVYLAESWIVKDPENDKANFYGYSPKKGTWMGILKVDNKQIWDEFVKTGRVKGFSVEGYFANIIEKYSKL